MSYAQPEQSCYVCNKHIQELLTCPECTAVYYCSDLCREVHAFGGGHNVDQCFRFACQRESRGALLQTLDPCIHGQAVTDLIRAGPQATQCAWPGVLDRSAAGSVVDVLALPWVRRLMDAAPDAPALQLEWRQAAGLLVDGLGERAGRQLIAGCANLVGLFPGTSTPACPTTAPHPVQDWASLCRLCGAPADSPLRLCLDAVLTVHGAALAHLGPAGQATHPAALSCHLLGAAWEVGSWPQFAVLSALWPSVAWILVLVGPGVPPQLDSRSVAWHGPRYAGGGPGLCCTLTFRRGLYQDLLFPPGGGEVSCAGDEGAGRLREVDLVVAPNAGLAVYPEWAGALRALCRLRTGRAKKLTARFTDYSAEAAWMGGEAVSKVLGGAPRPSVCENPFAQPLMVPQPDHDLPTLSNGFIIEF